MNKTELIDKIAAGAGLTKVDAKFPEAVAGALKKNEKVQLVGFGTFYAAERKARTGRNPQTGKAIKVKAAKVPKFKAGKALKDALNTKAKKK